MSNVFLYCALLLGLVGQAGSGAPAGKSSLDFEFFKTKVQPIFLAKRAGHARCAACHASTSAPAVFRLQPLTPGSTNWDEEQSRKNFEAASRLVIPGDSKSPLLVHALAEDAGGDFFHSGGKHFNSQDDPEWQTLKEWVLGQTGKTQARSR